MQTVVRFCSTSSFSTPFLDAVIRLSYAFLEADPVVNPRPDTMAGARPTRTVARRRDRFVHARSRQPAPPIPDHLLRRATAHADRCLARRTGTAAKCRQPSAGCDRRSGKTA